MGGLSVNDTSWSSVTKANGYADNPLHAVVAHEVVPHSGRAHRCDIAVADVGAVRVAKINAACHSVRRSSAHVATHDPGYIKVCLQLSGNARLTQRNCAMTLRAGDLVAYDTRIPYMIEYPTAYDALLVMIRRDQLAMTPRALSDLGVRRVGAGVVGTCLISVLREVNEQLHELTPEEGRVLGDSVVSMLSVAVRDTEDENPLRGERHKLLRTVLGFMEENLSNPELNPGFIAEAHYISISQLHSLFRGQAQTVSAYIRTRRLEWAQQLLHDPRHREWPITTVAHQVGFTDPAHFSRLYRSRFGIAPRVARHQV